MKENMKNFIYVYNWVTETSTTLSINYISIKLKNVNGGAGKSSENYERKALEQAGVESKLSKRDEWRTWWSVNLWEGQWVWRLTSNNAVWAGVLGKALVTNPPAHAGDVGSIPDSGDPLEKETATHSSIRVWEIPWTKEPGGL